MLAPTTTASLALSPAALATQLARFTPELRGRAMRLARCSAKADDLVQDTVERAMRFAGHYQAGTNLRAWAHQILFSVFVTGIRRDRRHRKAVTNLASDPCAWTQPEPVEPSAGLSPSVRRALATLPSAFREVVLLVDVEDRAYKDAARALGVPVGTVMSRLHRGRKLLAEALRPAAASAALEATAFAA